MAALEIGEDPLRRHSRVASILVLLAVLLGCAAYGFVGPRAPVGTPINAPSLVLFSLCAALFFFVFRYPLAFNGRKSWRTNLANFLCHIALAVGFGLFFHAAVDAGVMSIDSFDGNEGFFKIVFLLFLVPVAVGTFVAFFLQTILRFPGLLRFRWLMAGAFVLGACVAIVLEFLGPDNTPMVYLSAIVVLAVGLLSVAVGLFAVASELPLRKIIFDTFLVIAGISAYLVFSKPLIEAMTKASSSSIESDTLNQIALLSAILLGLFVLEGFLGLAGHWLGRSRRRRREDDNRPDNPSLILFLGRSVVALLSNFSVLLTPLAWLSYLRSSVFLQHRLDARYAVDRAGRRLSFYSGVAATICYLFLLFGAFFAMNASGGRPNGPVLAVALMAAAFCVWWQLRRISLYYENA